MIDKVLVTCGTNLYSRTSATKSSRERSFKQRWSIIKMAWYHCTFAALRSFWLA